VQSCLGKLSEVNAHACAVVAVLEADGGDVGHFKTRTQRAVGHRGLAYSNVLSTVPDGMQSYEAVRVGQRYMTKDTAKFFYKLRDADLVVSTEVQRLHFGSSILAFIYSVAWHTSRSHHLERKVMARSLQMQSICLSVEEACATDREMLCPARNT